MSKPLSLSTVIKEGIGLFREKHEGPNGRDDVALGQDVHRWLFTNHRELLRSSLSETIWRDIKTLLRSIDHATRPSIREIENSPNGIDVLSQPTLPSFEEIQREWYRPSHGRAVCFADLFKGQLSKVIREYGEGELEHRVKRLRLEVVYREMDRRGLADTDQVRALYVV